jgi:FKBP-type peptidyl-prolyl cis-trans isomerase
MPIALFDSTFNRRASAAGRAIFSAAIACTLFTLSACAQSQDASKTTTTSSTTATQGSSKMITTASGLMYVDEVLGTGAEAKAGQNVTVHYTGWLYDESAPNKRGKKFDSSKDRGDPFKFPLAGGRVIKGWDEGVQGMKVGGKRILTIPAALGYGARGAGGVIPPNATLIFEVDLLGV